ncbi:MAG: PEP-CTERM sorting domain-containing protein [Armatimonadetes bacterium]|nr:PEP-CTERM sorting domain-containing protein [Armatimonadota bacterium]
MIGIRTSGILLALVLGIGGMLPVYAAPVYWVNWISGTAGPTGSASGVLDIGGTTIDVSYSGEIAFIQTASGTNYWNPSTPYISAMVDNAPPAPDIIALSRTTSKTLTFSEPVTDLFFAFMSINGNGYRFDHDFEIVSTGRGYWGTGTVVRQDLGGGIYELSATSGEPHGVIRFPGAVSSLTWTSRINEHWNGFTVGTYGLVPEPGAFSVLGAGLLGLLAAFRRKVPA